jgi:hypothetical protein
LKAAGEAFINGPIPNRLRQEIESKILPRVPRTVAEKEAVKESLIKMVVANLLVSEIFLAYPLCHLTGTHSNSQSQSAQGAREADEVFHTPIYSVPAKQSYYALSALAAIVLGTHLM